MVGGTRTTSEAVAGASAIIGGVDGLLDPGLLDREEEIALLVATAPDAAAAEAGTNTNKRKMDEREDEEEEARATSTKKPKAAAAAAAASAAASATVPPEKSVFDAFDELEQEEEEEIDAAATKKPPDLVRPYVGDEIDSVMAPGTRMEPPILARIIPDGRTTRAGVPPLPGFHGAATKEDFLETHLMNVYVEALLKTGGVRASHKNTPNISKYVQANFATTERLEHDTIRKLLSRSWQASGLSDYAKAGISVLDTSVIAQLNTFITKNGGDRLRTKSVMDDLDEESLADGGGRNQDEDNDDDATLAASIAFGGAGAAAAAGTYPPIVARPMQRNMAAAAAPMLNPMMMEYPQPPIYTGPVLVARGISAKKDLEKARKKQQRSTTKAATTSAGPSKKKKRRSSSSSSSVGTTTTKKSALASSLGASSSVFTDPVTGKQKRQYGMHQNPEYIQIHLKGLYKWCCTENNYKVDATQYCKAVHGELHHRYRAFLQKHFKSAKLEKHLEQRIHFANRSITDKIEKHTEAYRQEELEKKRKKKEEAEAAKAALEAAKAAAAERGEPMEMKMMEAIAGGVAAADGIIDEGMDTDTNTNDATNRDPTNLKTTDTPSAPPRTDPLKIGEHVIARSILDYARLEVYNAEQDAIKKAKELKRNQEFGEKSKYSMKQRIYFNHKDPRYIREHLYGIYKHGYQNNQTVNVNQYCHNHFDYVRGRTKSATKYKSLMQHFKRSNLKEEMTKGVHYDSVDVQDVIDKYMNELVANKEVYEAVDESDPKDDDGNKNADNEENIDEKYPVELPVFYDTMIVELEKAMRIEDQTERMLQMNTLTDIYETKNWLTKNLVLEVIDACRYGAFRSPSPPLTPEEIAAAADAVATADSADAASVAAASLLPNAVQAEGGAAGATPPTAASPPSTAMETAMAMAAIASGTSETQAQDGSATGGTGAAAVPVPKAGAHKEPDSATTGGGTGTNSMSYNQRAPVPPPEESDYVPFSKAVKRVLPLDRKYASIAQMHQVLRFFMSFWDVPRLVHGSGALSCHYRKRTLKRQITPDAISRRRKSGQTQVLDDYDCQFKLSYTVLRAASKKRARDRARHWKPRLFHIAKVFNFNTCHNCKEFHENKDSNYQHYDKGDISVFADMVRYFKVPEIPNGGDTSASRTWMYDKDAWINMTNHFFDNCCTIAQTEEYNQNTTDVSSDIVKTMITINQPSKATQERKRRTKGSTVNSVKNTKVTNFDNITDITRFFAEIVRRNPNEAYRTNEWGGAFDVLRTICDNSMMGTTKMKEIQGVLMSLGTAADPSQTSNIEARNSANLLLKRLVLDDIIKPNTSAQDDTEVDDAGKRWNAQDDTEVDDAGNDDGDHAQNDEQQNYQNSHNYQPQQQQQQQQHHTYQQHLHQQVQQQQHLQQNAFHDEEVDY